MTAAWGTSWGRASPGTVSEGSWAHRTGVAAVQAGLSETRNQRLAWVRPDPLCPPSLLPRAQEEVA